MTHEELLYGIKELERLSEGMWGTKALRAVVELHTGKGVNNRCVACSHGNKCETIQVIEKEFA